MANTCIKCGFTCAAGCQFVQTPAGLFCKKCDGTAAMEELAEIRAVHKENVQKLCTAWKDLPAGEMMNFPDYATNVTTRYAVLKFADCCNVAIQTECNGAAFVRKSVNPQKYGQVVIKNMARGIGDSITAMYAACGIADAGFEVFYYDVHTEWITGIRHPLVHVINANDCAIPDNAIDLNLRYAEQCEKGVCRKQWYCDNFILAKGIIEFEIKPARPFMFNPIRLTELRADAGRLVLIAPYSNDMARNWTDDKWLSVITELNAKRMHCVIICGENQKTQAESTFTGEELQINKSAGEVMTLLSQAKAFIGVDSGMTHVAGLLGVPAIGISTQFSPSLLWNMTGITGFMADTSPGEIIKEVLA